jgi:hypothetical protein
VIEDVMLTLNGKEYSTACDSTILLPTTTKNRWKPVNGKKKTVVAKPDWALTLNLGQDFDVTSLQHELIEGHGTVVPFILQPQGASAAAKIEGFVTLEAVQVGGASETVAVAPVTLDVEGQPSFTWNEPVEPPVGG